MNNTVDIKSMAITELKSLGYDMVKLFEQTKQNLSLIENELLERGKTSVEVSKNVVTEVEKKADETLDQNLGQTDTSENNQ